MDEFLWLEDVTGDDALAWATREGEATTAKYAGEHFDALRERARAILDSDDKIAWVRRRGEDLYNFWQDGEHQRGLWRRTTLESYLSETPEWEIVLDLDALATADGENWVWGGGSAHREPDGSYRRALISLSRGGADATVVREFDLTTKEFVDEVPFVLAEAKSSVGWIDRDTLYVGTDLGEGTLTESGYPFTTRRWKRGTEIDAAPEVYRGEVTDVSAGVGYDDTPGFERHVAVRSTDFYNHELAEMDPETGALTLIPIPTDAHADIHHDWLFVTPVSEWDYAGTVYAPGTLLALDYPKFRDGSVPATQPRVLFTPDPHTSLQGWTITKNYLILSIMRDVKSSLQALTLGEFEPARLDGIPEFAEVSIVATAPRDSDEIFLSASSFTLPPTLLRGEVGATVAPIKHAPAHFDADGIGTEQFFATSLDGTQIPYFVVRKASQGDGTGPAPTLLGGYGGFEVSRTPGYSGVMGSAWLERGGTYVLANIRGGGEYGPQWHTSVLKENRHKVFEDFAAVATDLVARGITTPAQLAARGGSNGGLLMGVMYTRYPELFGAIVCQVPLLDMQRYHLLLAGASWVAEYGNPELPEEWEFLAKYSPYHQLPPGPDAGAGTGTGTGGGLPKLLVTTSTRDDRVHPGHARKFVAALKDRGIPVDYYENIEGGHGGAADNKQAAFVEALIYEFLWQSIGAQS